MSLIYTPELRGKCKSMAEEAVTADPSLRLVRGWYFCPIWSTNEQHWWTARPDGSIYDPTAAQFPSLGAGMYEEFAGTFECEECGREFPEDEAYPTGNSHLVCSTECFGRMVGF